MRDRKEKKNKCYIYIIFYVCAKPTCCVELYKNNSMELKEKWCKTVLDTVNG